MMKGGQKNQTEIRLSLKITQGPKTFILQEEKKSMGPCVGSIWFHRFNSNFKK
jgi:hypothetical protein